MKKILLILLVLSLVGCQNVQSDDEVNNSEAVVKLDYSETVSYIFHMFSVAKVGYDNEYGNDYKALHPSDDLEFLKSIEGDLIVIDGQSKGQLSSLWILAASLDTLDELELYFSTIHHAIDGEDITEEEMVVLNKILADLQTHGNLVTVDQLIKSLGNYHHATTKTLSQVFIDNIDIYQSNVQKNEQSKVESYIERFEEEKSLDNRIAALENLVGLTYAEKEFVVQLTNSTADGPNANNTGFDSNQFYTFDFDVLDEFINNEMIYFMLIQNDEIKKLTKNHSDANIYLESLAEYYNREYYNRNTLSQTQGDETIIEYYKANSELSAVELFQSALNSEEL